MSGKLTDIGDETTCTACDKPIRGGDLVYSDYEGGIIHAKCCGPERESYVDADGEPLKDGEPIPKPWKWSALGRTAIKQGAGE